MLHLNSLAEPKSGFSAMRRKFYTVLRHGTKSVTIVADDTKIVPLQEKGEEPIFFMIDSYPYFIDVVQLIGTDHPVLSLIGQEETQATEVYSIVEEAAAHVQTILERQPQGPYVLGGCSASGIVAFEVAQQLQKLGHEVALLALFDTPNPYFMGEYSAWRMSLASYRADLSRMAWRDVPDWLARKAGTGIGKIIDSLEHTFLPKTNGTVGIGQFGPLEIRIAASRQYRPATYSGTLLLVKRGAHQLNGRYLDPEYGWGEVAHGPLEVCVVRGADHLEIFEDETDRLAVARKLSSHLARIAMAESNASKRHRTSL